MQSDNIIKDKNTSIVFNNDLSGYEKIKEKREINKRFDILTKEINDLKQDLELLKDSIKKCAQ